MNSDKTILSLCDYTGRWALPYKVAGYNVIQWDAKKGQDIRLEKKVKGDVYGILAAPPCTEFSAAGARWWKDKDKKPENMLDAMSIVDACLRAVAIYKPKFWALENPVGRLKDWIGRYTYTFQPHEFAGYLIHSPKLSDAERYTKKTCLWGEFNEPIKAPLSPVHGSKMWAKYGGKSEATKAARSATPLGFSIAFFASNQ